MCGIAGIYDPSETPEPALLLTMAGELDHRGPDGVGLYRDEHVGLVNTRLAIFDLAGGDQPIGTPDGRYWVVQNGEIYNHPELRAELESLGHRFSTHCDTEVIVHAYQEWGAGCLERFNGPFAFAVWDRVTRELFLARDRYGVRPLFVARFGRQLVFASEAKAILRHPLARRELDPRGVVETFTLWSILPDRSAFAGIGELAPGHWLRVGPRGETTRRWWDLPFAPRELQRRESVDDLADELFDLLTDATRLRLRADVSVAAYLSGGLDSSAIAALAKRVGSGRLQCFGIGFADAHFDEADHQRRVADALGIELTQTVVDGADIAAQFPEVVRLGEKPILRTAPAPLLQLSKLARDAGFRVVLTGEGADEVLAGYTTFTETQVRRFWARNPSSAWRPALLDRLYPWLVQDLGRAPQFTRQFFAAGLTDTDDVLYSHLIRFATTSRNLRLLNEQTRATAVGDDAPIERLRRQLPAHLEKSTGLGRAQYVEIATFLSGYLLHSQGDRMLMGNSVEGRFPFLDHRVGEFAASLPDSVRLAGLKEKYLLRRAVGRVLPAEAAARPKRPFRAPIHRSFFGPGAPGWVQDVLSADAVRASGLFEPATVERLRRKCMNSLDRGLSEGDEMALVGVLSTQLLHQQFVADPAPAKAAVATRTVVGAELATTGGTR